MSLRGVMSGLRSLMRRETRNEEIAEELRGFEEASVADKMRRGMSREAAKQAARAEIGSVEMVRQKVWSAGWESMAEGVWQDVRYGARRLLHAPGFALTAIFTLALGIGANIVVFSVLNGLVLRPLAVPDPKSLYQIGRGASGGDVHSYPDYRDLRDRDGSFTGMLAYKFLSAGMQIGKGTVPAWGYATSGNYLHFDLTVDHWISEGLMMLFFFGVTLEDPHRFAKSRDAGCYIGLQPAPRNSGSCQPGIWQRFATNRAIWGLCRETCSTRISIRL